MIASKKIKPCPFCGQKNIDMQSGFGNLIVFCDNCEASVYVKNSTNEDRDIETVWAKWQKRWPE